MGFLAAAALSSAWTDSEFRSNISNAIRLAACLGLVVDRDANGGFCAVTVQCKKLADRTLVDVTVDCTAGVQMSPLPRFDHRFFSISGLEAKSMGPQQRLVLQVVYKALESTGGHYQAGTSAGRENVGCYLGVS